MWWNARSYWPTWRVNFRAKRYWWPTLQVRILPCGKMRHAFSAFVADIDPLVAPQVQAYNTGRTFARDHTINPSTTRAGQTLNLPGLANVLAGKDSVQTTYSNGVHTLIVDVFVPVVDEAQHHILGAIELRYERASVYDRFLRVRYLIIGVW